MTASIPDDDLNDLFALASTEKRVALAVSGGGDSMALLSLAERWARIGGPGLHVLTVDHGLRPESADEAQAVAAFCASRGIAHETLHWKSGPDDRGNLSHRARNGRYALMAHACSARGIGTLLTGHTLDDQAETVLMRLGRGSGVDGLAAMEPVASLWGLRILRPLLGVRREALRHLLRAAGLSWHDDPTNEDRAYRRIVARDALEALAVLGITHERLALTAEAMADARQVLDDRATALSAEICEFSPLGYVRLAPSPLAAAPRETARRLVARLLCAVSGAVYRPRLEALTALLDAIVQTGFQGSTLHGCRIDPVGERIVIQREPNACTARLPCADAAQWDNRFCIAVPPALATRSDIHIAAAGAEGLRLLKKAKHRAPEIWSSAPRPARLCSPALWRGSELLAIPLAQYSILPEASECRVMLIAGSGATMVDPATEDFI